MSLLSSTDYINSLIRTHYNKLDERKAAKLPRKREEVRPRRVRVCEKPDLPNQSPCLDYRSDATEFRNNRASEQERDQVATLSEAVQM